MAKIQIANTVLTDDEEWLVRAALGLYRDFAQKQLDELDNPADPNAAGLTEVRAAWTQTRDRTEALVKRLDADA